jgi:hypothetical protein
LRRLQAAVDRGKQRLRPKRLLQARDRAELGGHLQEVRLGVGVRGDRAAGDDDDGNRRLPRPDVAHGLQPVHSGHEDIEEQQIELTGFEQRERLVAVAGRRHLMPGPFQHQPDRDLHGRVVIHDQDVRHFRIPWAGMESPGDSSSRHQM